MITTTTQTRSTETIAASEAAPVSGSGLLADVARRASAKVTAVEDTMAPASELTRRPRVFSRMRMAT